MHLVAVGGSDAGISAGLRARELDPTAEVTVVVADAYPNFSICGIPYYISGEVTHWRNLAHRSVADLEGAGLTLRLDTVAPRSMSSAGESRCESQAGRKSGSRMTSWSSGPALFQFTHPSAASTNWEWRAGCTCCTRWETRSP